MRLKNAEFHDEFKTVGKKQKHVSQKKCWKQQTKTLIIRSRKVHF